MNVSEMIEWLKTQPQDAIVEVLCHDDNGGYYTQGGTCSTIEFTIEVVNYNCCFELTDLTTNPLIKPDSPAYNKKYLLLGMQK